MSHADVFRALLGILNNDFSHKVADNQNRFFSAAIEVPLYSVLLQIQTISQPELNVFNSSELLQHTEQSKKARLLRTLAKQYL